MRDLFHSTSTGQKIGKVKVQDPGTPLLACEWDLMCSNRLGGGHIAGSRAQRGTEAWAGSNQRCSETSRPRRLCMSGRLLHLCLTPVQAPRDTAWSDEETNEQRGPSSNKTKTLACLQRLFAFKPDERLLDGASYVRAQLACVSYTRPRFHLQSEGRRRCHSRADVLDFKPRTVLLEGRARQG
jgi:hypothetical protein